MKAAAVAADLACTHLAAADFDPENCNMCWLAQLWNQLLEPTLLSYRSGNVAGIHVIN